MTGAPVVLSSALRREQYVKLHRMLLRRQSRGSPQLSILLLVISGCVLLALDSPILGVRPPVLGAGILAFAAVVAALVAWQPYRLWPANEKILAASGTLTLDSAGVHREIPGVLDARVPWSSIESTVDSGEVVGLRISRYSWILVPLPDDADVAARVRDLVTERVPTR